MGIFISLFAALLSLTIQAVFLVIRLTLTLLFSIAHLAAHALGGSARSHGRARGKRGGMAALGVVIVILFVLGLVVAFPPVGIVLLILGIGAGVIWLVIGNARPKTQTAAQLASRFSQISNMTGGQFEVFVADVLRALSYQTTVLGGSGDQGVDIIAASGNGRIAVQCKNYAKAIGNKPVQEVYAGARHHGCEQAWVVAPAGYTSGALDLARSVGVRLFDVDSLRHWIAQADKIAAESARDHENGAYGARA